MRIPGRRHWTESVDLYTVASITSGPQTGAETWTLLEADQLASVQPVSDAEAIKHGLETDVPMYWVRHNGPDQQIGDGVVWQGKRYHVATASIGNDLDVQLLVRYVEGGQP